MWQYITDIFSIKSSRRLKSYKKNLEFLMAILCVNRHSLGFLQIILTLEITFDMRNVVIPTIMVIDLYFALNGNDFLCNTRSLCINICKSAYRPLAFQFWTVLWNPGREQNQICIRSWWTLFHVKDVYKYSSKRVKQFSIGKLDECNKNSENNNWK